MYCHLLKNTGNNRDKHPGKILSYKAQQSRENLKNQEWKEKRYPSSLREACCIQFNCFQNW